MKRYEQLHYDEVVFLREGAKAYNDKCAYFLTRDYSDIGVGEVLVADGHVLNFEILNPWTGKQKRMELNIWQDFASEMPLGWEIAPTENVRAIAAAFRRSLLMTGRIPAVAYLDNGKAFGADYFEGSALRGVDLRPTFGLYERLGIEVTNAWAYHGQSKPIERWFRDLARLERRMATYTGVSIERKPPRLNRGERIHRAAFEKATQGRVLTIAEAHAAIADFIDAWAAEPHREGRLAGYSSGEIFERGLAASTLKPIGRDELDYLMLETTVRKIYRDGVHHAGRVYFHPDLHGRRHAVTVRYDLADPSSIKIYDDEGRFLCDAAEKPTVKAMAKLPQCSDADRELLRSQIELKKSLEKKAAGAARAFLESEIMPAVSAQLAALPAAPEASEPAALSQPLNIERIEERAAKMRAVSDDDSILDRLAEMKDGDHYVALLKLRAAGRPIPPEENTWLRYYKQSDHYAQHAERYEALALTLARASASVPLDQKVETA